MTGLTSAATLDAGDLRIGASFVVLALVALAVAPRERRHVLRLLALYLGSLVLHVGTAVAEAAGLPAAAAAEHVVATFVQGIALISLLGACLLYTSPSPRDYAASRMPSSA